MSDADNPWPLWAENASKGDLIHAVTHMRLAIAQLAGVISSMRNNDNDEVSSRFAEYLKTSASLGEVLKDIGGGKEDGE